MAQGDAIGHPDASRGQSGPPAAVGMKANLLILIPGSCLSQSVFARCGAVFGMHFACIDVSGERCSTMKHVLIGLLLWISQNSAFHTLPQAPIPELQVLPQTALTRLLYEESLLARLTPKELRNLESDVAALYDNRNNTIYVAANIDVHSAHGNSVLVHELVHFLQFAQGKNEEADCISALEDDAYRIQAKYMKAHGLVPEFDEFTIRIRSTCYSG